jgi:hypothetical protein
MNIEGFGEVETACFFHRWGCHLHCSKGTLNVGAGWVVDNGDLE